MRTLLAMFAVLALATLTGCSSRNIVELNTQDVSALAGHDTYFVAPLEIAFDPPAAWEISDDDWDLWVEGWRVDYKAELREECRKTLEFVESAETANGPVVTCEIYEMDKGGFAGFGGNGFARAHIVIRDGNDVLYDARLEGTGANSGFEGAVVQGRMKFAVLNLAREIADVIEDGR